MPGILIRYVADVYHVADLSCDEVIFPNPLRLSSTLNNAFFPLSDSHTMQLLTPLGNKPFENTVGKGEIARNEQFLLFPQCFLPVWITFFHFPQI